MTELQVITLPGIASKVEYQVEQNPVDHRWTAVSHPGPHDEVERIYLDYLRSHPHIRFRIIKIVTKITIVSDSKATG